METNASNTPFSPTRWSLVLRAQGETPEAQAALSELCEAYYQPVYRFLRREGRNDSTALELTQSFFESVLTKQNLNPDPRSGRFRSYILGAVKHFLGDERKRGLRLKRGAGQIPVSLDDDEDSERSAPSVTAKTRPESWFDRQWALNLMDRSLQEIEKEFENKGKANQFQILKHSLLGDGMALSHSEAAIQLGWSETATKVAVHRLRKRFREIVRAEVAQTTPDTSETDAELNYLIEALQQSSA